MQLVVSLVDLFLLHVRVHPFVRVICALEEILLNFNILIYRLYVRLFHTCLLRYLIGEHKAQIFGNLRANVRDRRKASHVHGGVHRERPNDV